MWPFRRTQKPTVHDELHKYTQDLQELTKLRQQAMQRTILQPGADNQAEVNRYDAMIAGAQKVVLRLSRERD